MSVLGVDYALNCGDIRNLHITQRSHSSAASGALSFPFVGCEVERDEKKKIRAEYANACERGKFLSGTLAMVRHPWEVCRCEVGVGCEVNEAYESDVRS
jgi:hypothetical protein